MRPVPVPTPQIPPKGSGRPRSRASFQIEELEVGEFALFRIPQGTLGGMAAHIVRRHPERKFTTRKGKGGLVAVWRVA